MSLVSVIIPVYNGEKHIKRTIESVLNQEYKNIEIIIIDDGSEDKTEQIIEDIKKNDNRVRYYRQSNKGVSSARNRGISESLGSYISFLDADDTYKSCFISKLYKSIKENNSDAVFCGYEVSSNSITRVVKSKFEETNIAESYLKGKTNTHTNSWLLSREFINDNCISFNENLIWGEDVLFFTTILLKTQKINVVDDYLTTYYSNYSENQLSSFSLDKLRYDIKSMELVLSEVEKQSKSNSLKRIIKGYRLPALLTYRLIEAVKYNVEDIVIIDEFKRNKNYIMINYLNNDIRSIKLLLNQLLLSIFVLKKSKRKN